MSNPSLPLPKEASPDGDDVPVREYQVIERADLAKETSLPLHEIQQRHDQLQISRLSVSQS